MDGCGLTRVATASDWNVTLKEAYGRRRRGRRDGHCAVAVHPARLPHIVRAARDHAGGQRLRDKLQILNGRDLSHVTSIK